jgi:dihydrofolate reductase
LPRADRRVVMGNIVVGLSMSLDGIASGTGEEDFWAVHEAVLSWVFELRSWRAAQGMDGGADNTDSKIWAEDFARTGAQIVGRRMFDFSYPHWGDNPPFHVPVFVVTNRPADPIAKEGGTTYTFVNGLADAVSQARVAAGDKDVLIAGGLSIAQQVIAEGLADELAVHIAPVLIGRGARLYDNLGPAQIPLELTSAQSGERAVHLRFKVHP